MTAWSALILGFGLGLRHASDADHVVVVTTLIQHSPGVGSAARVAALWGLGHTATFLSLGLPLICFGLRVPPQLEQATEILVALMLLGFGFWHLRQRTVGPTRDELRSRQRAAVRPVLVGLVHGLAGSAGIALVAGTTIPVRSWAVAYLLLYGVGTIAGMVLLTVLIAPPLAWTQRAPGWGRRLSLLAALLNLGLGAAFLLLAVRRT
jgi:nickel/cobalt transporter (NicO) family protein